MTTIRKFTYFRLATLVFACFAVSSEARAGCVEGCFPNGNTGLGYAALWYIWGGNGGQNNTAIGEFGLYSNTTGNYNTANGWFALWHNTVGSYNTANGGNALNSNSTGAANVAIGVDALYNNTIGNYNTAVGVNALVSSTGSNNVGLGTNAGHNLTTGSGNVYIGAAILGVAGESNTTRIRNIYSSVASGRAVYVNSDKKIGTLSSSRRYKEEIKTMDKASETLFALKPVTFRYKREVDAERALSFGLIAEDVAEINPELITRDEKGNPQTVRYEAINAMLLNEFLKEHRKVEEQQKTIAELKSAGIRQQAEIAALKADLKEQRALVQRINDKVELIGPRLQTVASDQ